MTPQQEVDYALHDCFFAIGQTIGRAKQLHYDAVVWWRTRYHEKFLHAMTVNGNSWIRDRDRVTAVARYLGERAAHYAGDGPVIHRACAERASADVEAGCRMNAEREGVVLSAAGSDTLRVRKTTRQRSIRQRTAGERCRSQRRVP